MESKIIKKGEGVQEKILNGVDKAVEAIKTTLGPAGKCVALANGFGTEITRDGATVAKSISLEDSDENIGADLVKKASSLTEKEAGDGSSSVCILIQEFCKKGRRAVNSGYNVNGIKSGMLKAQAWVTNYIKTSSIEIGDDLEKIRKVATISGNNDSEVGDLVVEGMKKVGINGMLTADLATGIDTVIDVTPGMKLGRGWSSPQYVTSPEEGKCELDNPYILVVSEKISSVQQMVELLEDYQNNGEGRPLLVVCDDIDDNVSVFFIMNTLRGALRCCVVKGIDFGENRKNAMADLSVFVGADYIGSEGVVENLSHASLRNLGGAKRVVVTRDDCVIYEGYGDPAAIQERAAILKARLDDPKATDYDKTKFSKRLANLTGGIAIIRAGGATEAEKMNRKATIEDSILASKSAIEEGCMPGGGYVYFKASQLIKKDKEFWKKLQTEDEVEGAKIVVSSLPIIMKTVASNSGVNGDVILENQKTLKDGFGYNAKTKKVGNLIEEGVLDSAKVLRVALENSISTASMILLIDCTIVDKPVEDNNK